MMQPGFRVRFHDLIVGLTRTHLAIICSVTIGLVTLDVMTSLDVITSLEKRTRKVKNNLRIHSESFPLVTRFIYVKFAMCRFSLDAEG